MDIAGITSYNQQMTVSNDLNTISVLLVEDDPADVHLFMEALSRLGYLTVNLVCADSLANAFYHLGNRTFDVIISDLGLPDALGLEALIKIAEKVPTVPIIMLTGYDQEEVAVKALKSGAQDYLIKGQIDSNILYRSIRHSIERNRLIQELKARSITDELTGLYNRRGFMMLSKKQLELTSRMNKPMCLLYIDVDNLKAINDNLGHREGDNALQDTAMMLKHIFRGSDILARMGGDEFAVLAIESAAAGVDSMTSRLSNDIKLFNEKEDRAYKLSVSVGSVLCGDGQDSDIGNLLTKADKLMYEQKMKRKC